MQEGLSLDIYKYSVESLEHRLAFYLYENVNKKLVPITFRKNCLWTLMCDKNKHVMKRTEKKYGEIMEIIDVCTDCGYGVGEIFPIRKGKVTVDGN